MRKKKQEQLRNTNKNKTKKQNMDRLVGMDEEYHLKIEEPSSS